MAKSQRSSRKKALRTQRAAKVTAGWTAEAEAQRLAALAACMEAAPVPVVNIVPTEPEQPHRGREGNNNTESMAVDSSSSKSSRKKKGRKPAAAAAGLGVQKKRKQTAGVKLAKEFSKRQKKHRR